MKQNWGPEINSYIYSQLIFGKDSKQFCREMIIFSTNVAEIIGNSYANNKTKQKTETFTSHTDKN